MAIARDTAATNIEPLEGATIRRYTAGAAIEAGEIVSMQSDGYVDPSDSTAAAQMIVGVAIAGVTVGNRVDIVIFGPITCLTGATPGTAVYDSTTAGEPSATQAGNQKQVGFAESATVLFVRPLI
jgi:hypothetical protein